MLHVWKLGTTVAQAEMTLAGTSQTSLAEFVGIVAWARSATQRAFPSLISSFTLSGFGLSQLASQRDEGGMDY
jgi:hypothetical protein